MTHSGLDELVGVSPSAYRKGNTARGPAWGGAGGEGLLADPVGGGGVQLEETCRRHGRLDGEGEEEDGDRRSRRPLELQ